MKTIEINTAQKVSIQYELASLTNRISAYIIDFIIIVIVISILLSIGGNLFYSEIAFKYYSFFVVAPCFVFYTLSQEILLDGITIGKKIAGIKVVKLNGDSPSGQDFFMRWIFRIIDIFLSLGSLASILINASKYSQRLGGILSGTTVIRTQSQREFSLNDILSINTTKNYTPTYLNVTKFNEKEMLFVKKVLERNKSLNNVAHKNALKKLALHISEQLELDKPPSNYNQFLVMVLNDYIVLTR